MEEANRVAWLKHQANVADEPEQPETFEAHALEAEAIDDWSTEQVDAPIEQPVVAPQGLVYNAEDAIGALNVAYVDAVLNYAAGVVNENLELRRITAAALLQARIAAGLPPVAETPRRRWWHRR